MNFSKDVSDAGKNNQKSLGKNLDIKSNFSSLIANIKCSSNNTIVTITDHRGNAITSASAGSKFKGAKKSSPYAAITTVQDALAPFIAKNEKKDESKRKIYTITVQVNGIGSQKDSAIRAFFSIPNVILLKIIENTKVAHNGTRKKKYKGSS